MRAETSAREMAPLALVDTHCLAAESGPPVERRTAAETHESTLRSHLQAMAAGDERALRAFYEATVSRVYGFALRILGNAASAEETVSDVYHQVWRSAGRYDETRGSVITYLLTICRSRALDLIRKRDPAMTYGDVTEAVELVAEDDTHGLLESLQTSSAVRRAVESLTPRQRQLIALAFFRGYTHIEIADHLGMPLGTVKTQIRSALRKLRGELFQLEAP